MPQDHTLIHMDERHVRAYFRLSVILKGVISAAEIVAGVLAFFVPVTTLTAWALGLVPEELTEHADFISTSLTHLAAQLSVAGSTFIALYLLSRGLVKLVLIVAMLRDALWAYPSSLGVIGAFVLYQCWQISTTHSVALVLLTLFDLVVMYFIWREWRVLAAHRTVAQ